MGLTRISGDILQTPLNVGVVTASQVNVGSAVTIHSGGFQVGGSDLHSSGLTVQNLNATGVITATSFIGDGSTLTGIAGTADVRTNSLVVSGVSTLGNTVVGGATTELIVNGDARITGILTVGTSSITFDGTNNSVTIGTGVTVFGNTGIISATEFRGNGANLTGVSPFSAGTLMLFQQTSAPTGWTKETTHNDKTLRVVSGAASSGGTTAFTSVFASRTPTGTVGNTTLTTAQIPSHRHGLGIRNGNANLGDTSSADAFGQAGGGGSNLYSSAAGFTLNGNIISYTGGGGLSRPAALPAPQWTLPFNMLT